MLPRPSSASVGFENENNWKDLANVEVHKSKEVSYIAKIHLIILENRMTNTLISFLMQAHSMAYHCMKEENTKRK